MSGFGDVTRSTCQVVLDDGVTHNGTAFCVLDGYLLTCHHVLFGLRGIKVKLPGLAAPVEAQYMAALSNPAADIGVLQIPAGLLAPIQIDRTREGVDVYGFGYRPKALSMEPDGHTFSGRLGPGQRLIIPISESKRAAVAAVPAGQRAAWNDYTDPARVVEVCTLEGASGLEPGISGGPVYDPVLRRVTGLFRAVEGDTRAYVIPMDVVFRNWEALEQTNAATVGDQVLDTLQREFSVRTAGESAAPKIPILRPKFAVLFAEHTVFGGRRNEIAKLNAFAADPGRRYYFVTGPAGFGKTALLANWITATDHRPTSLVYHFLSKTVGDSTDLPFVFGNLCEQLMAFHRLGGDLPDALRLPILFERLLRLPPPPGQRLLIVLDGLDEAIGRWEPVPEMFPPDLPEGTQILFSAREMADRDWLAELKLQLDANSIMHLGTLDRAGVAEALAAVAAGSITAQQQEPLAARLWDLSAGDAFYLKDLLGDLKDVGYDPARLAAYPMGHNNYMKSWWEDAQVEDPTFIDLMGLLVVARDSLTRRELAGISTDDKLIYANTGRIIAKAARYLVGSETEGYRFGHSRIVEFVASELFDVLPTYRTRLAGFCSRWKTDPLDDHARRYILAHAAHHLADAGEYDALFNLLDADWIAAKWRSQGSYAGLIGDFDVAADLAFRREQCDVARVAAMGVARSTARTIMIEFPAAVMIALVRLGYAAGVIEMMRAERGVDGHGPARGPEALLRIAHEFLCVGAAATDARVGAERTEFALQLLVRALWMAQNELQLGQLVPIIDVLKHARTLSAERKAAFVEQIRQQIVRDVADPVFRGAALGMLAQAAVEPATQAESSKAPAVTAPALTTPALTTPALTTLVSDAEAVADQLADVERFAVMVCLLPAKIVAEGLDPIAAAQSAIAALPDPFASARLIANPLFVLVDTMPLDRVADVAAATAFLTGLAGAAISQDRASVPLASALTRALLRLGAVGPALDFVNQLAAQTPQRAATVLVGAVRELRAAAPASLTEWLTWAVSHLTPSDAALGWAKAGDWDQALLLLANQQPTLPIDRARFASVVAELISLVEAEPPTDAAATPTIVARLVELGGIDPGSCVEHLAAAACALAASDRTAAAQRLEQAVARQFANFPQGDTDRLWRFLALALHQEGKSAEAAAVVVQIRSPETILDTIRTLLLSPVPDAPARDAITRDVPNDVAPYCRVVIDLVKRGGFADSFPLLRSALTLLAPLRGHCPEATDVLAEPVQAQAHRLLQTLEGVWRGFAQDPSRLWKMGLGQLADLLSLAAATATLLPAEALATLQQLDAVAEKQPPQAARLIMLLRERALPAAALDVDRLRQAIDLCLRDDEAAQDADGWLGDAPGFIGPAIMSLAFAGDAATVTLLRRLLDVVLKIRTPSLLASALMEYWPTHAACASIVSRTVAAPTATASPAAALPAAASATTLSITVAPTTAALPAATSPTAASTAASTTATSTTAESAGAVSDAAWEAIARVLPAGVLRLDVIAKAVEALCAFGDTARATAYVATLTDADEQRFAAGTLEAAVKFADVGTLSPLESLYVERDFAFARLIVTDIHAGRDRHDWLKTFSQALAKDLILSTRQGLLDAGVWPLLLPAYRLFGSDAIRAMLETIDSFDRRFRQAGIALTHPTTG